MDQGYFADRLEWECSRDIVVVEMKNYGNYGFVFEELGEIWFGFRRTMETMVWFSKNYENYGLVFEEL